MTLFTRPRPAFTTCTLVSTATLALALSACGRSPVSSTSAALDQSERAFPSTVQSYGLWCQEWQLDCTTQTSDIKLAPEAWQVFSATFLELLRSPSQFTLTRADLDAKDLVAGLDSLKLGSLRVALAERLDGLGWSRASLSGGQFKLAFSKGGWLPGSQGLNLGLSPASTLTFTSSESATLSGFKLQAQGGQGEVDLNAIQFTSPETLTLVTAQEQVQDVPNSFVAQLIFEALGGGDAELLGDIEVSRTDAIASLYPLFSWLNQPSRSLSLQRSFFAATAERLASLKETDPSLLAVLSVLDTLKTASLGSGNVATLSQTPKAKLACEINQGELTLSFERSFGIKRFYAAAEGGIGLEFFGVKASSNKTWGSFPIKRIEITPENYVILDVPVLNKIAISWEQLEKESAGKEVSTVCASR